MVPSGNCLPTKVSWVFRLCVFSCFFLCRENGIPDSILTNVLMWQMHTHAYKCQQGRTILTCHMELTTAKIRLGKKETATALAADRNFILAVGKPPASGLHFWNIFLTLCAPDSRFQDGTNTVCVNPKILCSFTCLTSARVEGVLKIKGQTCFDKFHPYALCDALCTVTAGDVQLLRSWLLWRMCQLTLTWANGHPREERIGHPQEKLPSTSMFLVGSCWILLDKATSKKLDEHGVNQSQPLDTSEIRKWECPKLVTL